MIFKSKPLKNPAYLKWVKSLDCSVCGAPADDPHHKIGGGNGRMGSKESDYMSFPLCRFHHDELHRDWAAFERAYGTQIHHITKVIETLWSNQDLA